MRHEQARATVVSAMEEARQPAESGDAITENLVNAVDRLAQFGPDVVPFLAAELELGQFSTYPFCAYALGRIPTPESEATLRQAMLRADGEDGDQALLRKAWAGWALGLQGQVDVVDQLNAGRRRSARVPIHADTTALEAAALQTAPASVALLLAQLERYTAQDELKRERTWTLKALRRIAEPSAVPGVAVLLEDPDAATRVEAAHTLSTMRTAEAVHALLEALQDSEVGVRRAAANSLEQIRLKEGVPLLYARLETEEDAMVRGALYRTIAQVGGARSWTSLRKHWGRPDPMDRMGLVKAAGLLGGRDGGELLRKALQDQDNLVAVEAARSLGQLATGSAVNALLSALSSPRWPVVQTAAEELVRLRCTRAAPLIADRLLRDQLAGPIADPAARIYIEKLGEALVELRFAEPASALREATARQTDAGLMDYLSSLSRRLEALRENDEDLTRWLAGLHSDLTDLRLLTYTRLAQLGGDTAAAALKETFDKVGLEERVQIVQALGAAPAPASFELIERVLLEPEFDPVQQQALREMAAWSARRLGGPRMFEALKSAAERRNGRDTKVLIYLAVLGGKQALPVLSAYRLPRMHYLKWTRGKEQTRLDAIARDISAGFSLAYVDVPPSRISFY